MKKEEIHYDGLPFEYEGKQIYSYFTNWKIEERKHIEKVSAIINFTDKKEYLGFAPFYEDYDDVKPLRPEMAKKYYIKYVVKKDVS